VLLINTYFKLIHFIDYRFTTKVSKKTGRTD